jgi:two-component SAPR family response regulator
MLFGPKKSVFHNVGYFFGFDQVPNILEWGVGGSIEANTHIKRCIRVLGSYLIWEGYWWCLVVRFALFTITSEGLEHVCTAYMEARLKLQSEETCNIGLQTNEFSQVQDMIYFEFFWVYIKNRGSRSQDFMN